MVYKSSTTKDIEKTLKQEQEKGNTEMKTKLKTFAKYALTVIVTLAIVAVLYALYSKGVADGKYQQKNISHEIAAQVATSKIKQSH